MGSLISPGAAIGNSPLGKWAEQWYPFLRSRHLGEAPS